MDPDGSPNLLMVNGSTSGLVAQIVILVLLICINAFFSASEMAIISLNDGKLKRDAEEGHKKARILLKLTQAPSSFLSTIQVGVTLSSFLIAACLLYTSLTINPIFKKKRPGALIGPRPKFMAGMAGFEPAQ